MKLNDYQVAAMATAVYTEYVGLAYTSLGLAGEAGEIANKVKKIYRDNDGELTRQAQADLMDELGDVLWYVAALATEIGYDLDDVAAAWPAGTNTPMTVVRLGNGKSFQVYVEYLRFVDLWATAKEGITDA